MFSQWPTWLSRWPFVRRSVIKFWRVLLRIQRASLAKAVLVVRRQDDLILVFASPSGELQLPDKQLDAWVPITTQVEEWLDQLLPQASAPSLVSVDGTPGSEGVTFLYTAKGEAVHTQSGEGTWLHPDIAAVRLGSRDNRLLCLCSRSAP
jgi:hypothetical protein